MLSVFPSQENSAKPYLSIWNIALFKFIISNSLPLHWFSTILLHIVAQYHNNRRELHITRTERDLTEERYMDWMQVHNFTPCQLGWRSCVGSNKMTWGRNKIYPSTGGLYYWLHTNTNQKPTTLNWLPFILYPFRWASGITQVWG